MSTGNKVVIALTAIILLSCRTTKDASGKKCYRKTKVNFFADWSGKSSMTYLELQEGNYFRYYQKVFLISVNMNEWPGTYTRQGDSLIFHFCGGSPPPDLNGRGLLDSAAKKIILYGANLKDHQDFVIRPFRK
jgi:hypothetical protein